ncbi:hypothetical protein K438DRAFT_1758760 [Mycena galopus ATCC 62051]|nr:hypothetical protein K438DRAFT_1758760 [Mycena galopus ATCC 62051]
MPSFSPFAADTGRFSENLNVVLYPLLEQVAPFGAYPGTIFDASDKPAQVQSWPKLRLGPPSRGAGSGWGKHDAPTYVSDPHIHLSSTDKTREIGVSGGKLAIGGVLRCQADAATVAAVRPRRGVSAGLDKICSVFTTDGCPSSSFALLITSGFRHVGNGQYRSCAKWVTVPFKYLEKGRVPDHLHEALRATRPRERVARGGGVHDADAGFDNVKNELLRMFLPTRRSPSLLLSSLSPRPYSFKERMAQKHDNTNTPRNELVAVGDDAQLPPSLPIVPH